MSDLWFLSTSGGQLAEDICSQSLWSSKGVEEGRIFWGAFGTLLDTLPFLPLTINVPDVIYGMGDMIYNMYQYAFGSGGSTDTTSRDLYSLIEQLL